MRKRFADEIAKHVVEHILPLSILSFIPVFYARNFVKKKTK